MHLTSTLPKHRLQFGNFKPNTNQAQGLPFPSLLTGVHQRRTQIYKFLRPFSSEQRDREAWGEFTNPRENDPNKIELTYYQSFGSCVFCAPLDRHIGRRIDRYATDMAVDVSTDTQSICRSTYRPTLGRYVDRDMSVDISTDMSTDMSVEYPSICQPTCWSRIS